MTRVVSTPTMHPKCVVCGGPCEDVIVNRNGTLTVVWADRQSRMRGKDFTCVDCLDKATVPRGQRPDSEGFKP